MSEYDLICDLCLRSMAPADGTDSWVRDERGEHAFALTHKGCVPPAATAREEVRRLIWPNEFLRSVTDRFGHRLVDPEPLRAIVSALAPFVHRPDNGMEMDALRAAAFGAVLGVSPARSRTVSQVSSTGSGK